MPKPEPPAYLIELAKKHNGNVWKWKEYPEKGFTNVILTDGRKFRTTYMPLLGKTKSTAKRDSSRSGKPRKPRKENNA